MLRGVIDLVSRTDPAKLEPLLKNIAQGSAPSRQTFCSSALDRRSRAEKAADLVLQVASHMTDTTLGGFVAEA